MRGYSRPDFPRDILFVLSLRGRHIRHSLIWDLTSTNTGLNSAPFED